MLQGTAIFHKFFNIKDGLPQSQVLSIAEDKLGYYGRTYGVVLARFDGKHFSVFTKEDGMRDNYVHKSIYRQSQQCMAEIHKDSPNLMAKNLPIIKPLRRCSLK